MGAVKWIDRPRVLAPIAACAHGPAAEALAAKLSTWPADRLAKLSGVAAKTPEWTIVVLARNEDQLPWVDGIRYLGKDPLAPKLLLPTAEQPDVPLGLFERAITEKAGIAGPLAVLAPPLASIISLHSALPLSVKKLRELIEVSR